MQRAHKSPRKVVLMGRRVLLHTLLLKSFHSLILPHPKRRFLGLKKSLSSSESGTLDCRSNYAPFETALLLERKSPSCPFSIDGFQRHALPVAPRFACRDPRSLSQSSPSIPSRRRPRRWQHLPRTAPRPVRTWVYFPQPSFRIYPRRDCKVLQERKLFKWNRKFQLTPDETMSLMLIGFKFQADPSKVSNKLSRILEIAIVKYSFRSRGPRKKLTNCCGERRRRSSKRPRNSTGP